MLKKNQIQIIAEPGKQELFIIREFDAPRELVFQAFTDPELVVQWMGPRNLSMKIDYYDARDGGSWRYISSDPEGNEYAFRGVFHEIMAPERAIQTFEFEMMKGHVVLDSALFEPISGGHRTKLTIHSVYQSIDDRDGMVQSGMEGGLNDGYERLDEILATQMKG